MSNKQFIHFGCWGELNKTTKVINVMDKLSSYLSNNNVEFISIAGDNYYPNKGKITIKKNKKEKEIIHDIDENKDTMTQLEYADRKYAKTFDKQEKKEKTKDKLEEKVKIFIPEKFNSIMDMLPKDIPLYLLWGNHDVLDKTVLSNDYNRITSNYDSKTTSNEDKGIIINELSKEKIECNVINQQLEWIKSNPNITPFKDMIVEESFPNTLILMIDTTIYEEDQYVKCYNENDIFNEDENTIDILRTIQKDKIQAILNNSTEKHIIFIGHHPIKAYKEKGIQFTPHLYNLFLDLIDLLQDKNIYYLCADTHIYQSSKLTVAKELEPSKYIEIYQQVVGTGGAETDKLGKLTNTNSGYPLKDTSNLDLFIYEQKQKHGYLICEYIKPTDESNPLSMDKWNFIFDGNIEPNPEELSGGFKILTTKKKGNKMKLIKTKKNKKNIKTKRNKMKLIKTKKNN